MELYAIRERRGGPWDWARGLREQAGFDDHARFMDGLVETRFVLLGGPLEGDREVLLVVSASSADAIRDRLGADPWLQDGTLSIVSIERWTILLDGLHQVVAGRGRDSPADHLLLPTGIQGPYQPSSRSR